MKSIKESVEEIRKKHLAHKPAGDAELARLKSLGLPEDVIEFYSLTNGARIHEETSEFNQIDEDHRDWKCSIIPSDLLCSIFEKMYITPDGSELSLHQRYWIPIVDVLDGNYLSISTEPGHYGEIIDCFHESVCDPGYNSVVAMSFSEMIHLLIDNEDAFWLHPDRTRYGTY